MKARTKTKARASLVKELHYTDEEKKAVESIKNDKVITNRKDRIRKILHGPLCCICMEMVPSRRVEYSSGRIECYCEEHFSIYQKQKDVDIDTIMEGYGCTRAPKNYFGGSKKEENKGYSLTPKDSTIICSKCRVTRICFEDSMRGHNNVLIPLEYNNNFRPHDCDYSYPFRCQWCDAKLVFNRKIRTDNGHLIPIHFEDDKFHVCPKKPNRNRNIDDV